MNRNLAINEFSDYENVSNRIISTLMRFGNTYLRIENYLAIKVSLEKLFGNRNVEIKSSEDTIGCVVSISKTGKQHCIEEMKRLQTEKEFERDLDYLEEITFNERWGINE